MGGYQKQKLIDSLIDSNKGMEKRLAEMEMEQRALKLQILRNEQTIQKRDKAIVGLEDDKEALMRLVAEQERQLNDF